MSKTERASVAVRILHPSLIQYESYTLPRENAVLPRSRLYGFVPREGGTLWGESLTSYLNRLGWRYGISPRWLVAQEIVPYLSNKDVLATSGQLGQFSRTMAVFLNGVGESSLEWSSQLERLTARSDLRFLTLLWWIGRIPSPYGLVRQKMAWCPCCYEEWKEKGEPVYQPLIWTLRVVSMCMKHHCWLVELCPVCKQRQSAITRETLPGYCTQCNVWLGTSVPDTSEQVQDKEMMKWQQWILDSLDELREMSSASGILSWSPFFDNLRAHAIFQTLFQLSGMASIVRWQSILEFSYLCDTTPLQLLRNRLPVLEEPVERLVFPPTRMEARVKPQVDIERCRNLLQAILYGDEELLTIDQIANRVGCSRGTIKQRFPHEYALITQQGKAFRKQRRAKREERICEEVREMVFTLHSQGVFPTTNLVAKMLSLPFMLRRPDALEAFHAARRELGLE